MCGCFLNLAIEQIKIQKPSNFFNRRIIFTYINYLIDKFKITIFKNTELNSSLKNFNNSKFKKKKKYRCCYYLKKKFVKLLLQKMIFYYQNFFIIS